MMDVSVFTYFVASSVLGKKQNMEAPPARVIQYFNGEKQNLIPLFQRPYSWKKIIGKFYGMMC